MKLYYGEEEYLIEKRIKSLKNGSKNEIIYFDEESSIEEILLELTTYSIFKHNKILIFKNIKAFKDNVVAEKLIPYFDKNDSMNEIIFVWSSNTKPVNSKLWKFLNEKSSDIKKHESLNNSDLMQFIKDYVLKNNGNISNSACILLSNKLPNNLSIIELELKKLLSESKTITNEMIKTSIGDYLIDDTFAFLNALSILDINTLMNEYQKKINLGFNETYLISQITSMLILCNKVKKNSILGKTNSEIASDLNVHIFRIKKAQELLNNFVNVSIEQLIEKISQLDFDIKTGKVEAKVGFDNFLLNLVQ